MLRVPLRGSVAWSVFFLEGGGPPPKVSSVSKFVNGDERLVIFSLPTSDFSLPFSDLRLPFRDFSSDLFAN